MSSNRKVHVLGWDEDKNQVYFLASMENKKNEPNKRHVFKISINQDPQGNKKGIHLCSQSSHNVSRIPLTL